MIPQDGRETLFRGSNVSVFALDEFPGPVFITFNPLIGIAPGEAFWGERFFRQLRVAAIGIVSSGEDWFSPRDMGYAIEAIRRRTEGRRTLTYGFSRGGYGALKFSRALGAERAISFGPRFTDWVDRKDGVGPQQSDRDVISSDDFGRGNYVFFDPRDARDLRTIGRIQAAATRGGNGVKTIPMPFSGHSSLAVFIESGTAPELIRQFASGIETRHTLGALFRQARRRSTTYHLNRLTWLIDRRERNGLRRLSRDLSSIPPGPVRTFAKMCLLIADGRHDDAAALLEQIPDPVLSLNMKLPWCLQYFCETRFLVGALRIGRLFIEAFPDDLRMRVHLAISYLKINAREAALREFDDLLTKDGIERLHREMATLAAWLGRSNPFPASA